MIDLSNTPYCFWYYHGKEKIHISRSWSSVPLCGVGYSDVEHSWGVGNRAHAVSGVCKRCLNKFYLERLAE